MTHYDTLSDIASGTIKSLEARGMSLREIAERGGLSLSSVWEWRDKVRPPKLEYLEKILNVAGRTLVITTAVKP
jgi:transcriptional regulator with XRE-family HTH domain